MKTYNKEVYNGVDREATWLNNVQDKVIMFDVERLIGE